MIVCESLEKDFQVRFSDGENFAVSDTTPEHGGSGEGFKPHDLLEAALGNCIVIISRMYAKKHGLALEGVRVQVNLDRQDPAKAVFEYSVEYQGALSPENIEKLKRAVKACPVHKTLCRQLEFKEI